MQPGQHLREFSDSLGGSKTFRQKHIKAFRPINCQTCKTESRPPIHCLLVLVTRLKSTRTKGGRGGHTYLTPNVSNRSGCGNSSSMQPQKSSCSGWADRSAAGCLYSGGDRTLEAMNMLPDNAAESCGSPITRLYCFLHMETSPLWSAKRHVSAGLLLIYALTWNGSRLKPNGIALPM